MSEHWELIESSEALDALLARYADSEVVALDTEFMRRNTFFPQVALVQLCFEDSAYLVDPLAVEDCAALVRLLVDTRVLKVMHSPSEDLEVFQSWLGVLPRPLYDTQRAAALLGLDFGMGYRALVAELCDVDLPKGETRSDWLKRPLTQSQCDYAAMDVTYLLKAWQLLEQRAAGTGRRDWILADGEDAVLQSESGPGDYYPRIKSAWQLPPRELAALRELCQWREVTARERDRPRSWIIDDKTCLQLARSQPTDLGQLRREVDLPPPVLRRHGQDLLDCLDAAAALPDDEMPPTLPRPLDNAGRQSLKQLKDKGRVLAKQLSVAPEILLSGKDYELLLRRRRGEAIVEPRSWQGWRGEAIISPLARSLEEDAR